MQGAFDRRHFSLLTSSKSRLANSRLPAKVNHRVQHNPTLHPSANRRQSSPAPRAALCALVSLSDLLAEFKEHRPVPSRMLTVLNICPIEGAVESKSARVKAD